MARRSPQSAPARPLAAPPDKLKPIDYLRIGRAIGRSGYCGECIGCLAYRDHCDYALELTDADYERDQRVADGLERAAKAIRKRRSR